MTLVTPFTSAPRIGVIGLGYVGLPLALEFGSTGQQLDMTLIRSESVN